MLLEEMGRSIASNPMTPFGRVRRWLREVATMPKGTIRPDYPYLNHLHRLITATARAELECKELTPDTAKISTLKPCPKTLTLISQACSFSRTVVPGGICWLDEIHTYMAFLNELSSLVHHYEAITQPVKVSRLVYASEDAKERFIKEGLLYEKAVLTLSTIGLIGTEPESFFAIALKDRLDMRGGASPGHLIKSYPRHALYTDHDLDVVWTFAGLHKKLKGKGPLLSHSKPSLNEFYFINPPETHQGILWALAPDMDLRNLLFMRPFHDTVKTLKRSSASKARETLENLFNSYTPYFERKPLMEIIDDETRELILDELAIGIADYLNCSNSREKTEILEQAVGRASSIVHLKVLRELERYLLG